MNFTNYSQEYKEKIDLLINNNNQVLYDFVKKLLAHDIK